MKAVPISFVAAAVAFCALPAAADAADYCVAPNTSCGGTQVAKFEQALALAAGNMNPDRIFLGDATYTAPTTDGFVYDQPAPLQVIGSGQGQTTLTTPPGTVHSVVRLSSGPDSSIERLRITLPSNAVAGASGLQTNATARQITVTAGPQANSVYGVALVGGTLESSVVGVGMSDTGGVVFDNGGGTVRGSSVSADTGIVSSYGGVVERSKVIATRRGIVAYRDATRVAATEIQAQGAGAWGIWASPSAGSDATVELDGVGIFGSAPDSVGVLAENGLAPASHAEVALRNSIIRGVGTPLRADVSGTGTVHLVASYSDYRGPNTVSGGANASITETSISDVGDTGFVDVSDGDYRLTPGSPLIDAGDPTTAQGLDVVGNPLVTDGDLDGVARRDIGAHERPAPAPDSPAVEVPGVSPPPAPAAADTLPPEVTRFRAGRARVRFTLSERARVTVTIRPTRRGTRRPRTLRRDARTGANSIGFGRRALRPGRYRAEIRAKDAAGNPSTPRRIRFRVAAR